MTALPLPAWPKAVLFDLDDTLWPIAPVIEQAERQVWAWIEQHAPGIAGAHSIDSLRQARLQKLAREPHFHLDLAALRRAGLLDAFAASGDDVGRVDEAMAIFSAARNLVAPYADVLDGLERLGRRTLIGSISNGNADLRAIGLDHHFKVSVAAHSFGQAKPAPAIFLAACAELGVAPAEAVYVGDDVLLDVRGAQQAGLRAVWLNRTGSARHLEHGVTPDAICADFDQLLDWLENNHA
ncbi:HAD family hydrolase [Massilia sp. DWR3-1-1]|uniref:HAD family hydrolase n=1 Tax=Massilia sp. DWR3-1-1 TaxID=2804559 RepID=UPI003CE8F1FF